PGLAGRAERRGVEVGFPRLEPALLLAREPEALVPGVGRGRRRPSGEQQDGARAVEGQDADAVRNRLDPHPPSVAPGHPVVVAVVDEDGEGERQRAAGALERVANVGGVGSLLHPDPLLEPRGPDGVGPNGARALEPPALDLAVAVRLDGAAGPAIRREGPSLALV